MSKYVNYNDFDVNCLKLPKFTTIGKGKHKHKYLELHCAFDIETTTLIEEKRAYMYIWQFQINEVTIIGRTMPQFIDFLDQIKKRLYAPGARLIVWVANLGFEFQFIRKYFEISEMFAKKKREPLKFLLNGFFEFHDALAISGGSLEQLAKDYTETKKLVGDLDYSILRNYKTLLSEKELDYCINDVVILKEFSEYIWEKFIKEEKFLPLTKTGILRKEVKDKAKEYAKEIGISFKHLQDYVKSLFPKSESIYTFYMEYLFRGGFTHANIKYVNETIKDKHMYGIDFTSSYPAVMLQEYYPITPFKLVKFDEKYLKTHCCILYCVFKNIKTKTTHTIESKNKIIKYKNAIFDNGRLYKAEYIYVCLTELDYLNYCEFYEWDIKKSKVINCFISKKGLLPRYLLDVLVKHYIDKDNLKEQGLKDTTDYALCKSLVNSAYGLTVTRLTFNDVSYSNSEWGINASDKTYDEMISNQVLSPFFGIWITAHARRRELHTLKLLNNVMYSDTDSHKVIGFDKIYILKEFNKSIIRKNHKICEYYGYAKKHLLKIGTFDLENLIYKFKTMGAKRYIYSDNDGLHQTISGLYKKSLEIYCNDNNLNPFDFFSNQMYIPSDYTFKLSSTYNDDFTSDIINGEKMTQLSSVALTPVDFTLKLDPDYITLIQKLYERNERRFRKNEN